MWDELDQNFKQVSSCARTLDPCPLSRLRNEGFSANTFYRGRPTFAAPGHMEMILESFEFGRSPKFF